jgi:hypothetical protein
MKNLALDLTNNPGYSLSPIPHTQHHKEITAMDMFRQGDVFGKRVDDANLDDIEKKSIELDTDKGAPRVVFAYGEVTGHAHAIAYDESNMEWFEDAANGNRYFRVLHTPVELRHEEHSPITLDPGTYRVKRQREYTPEEIRPVAD